MNWNIDESPYPGPSYSSVSIYLNPANPDWVTQKVGNRVTFKASVLELPSQWEINDEVELLDSDDGVVFVGYLNEVEIMTSIDAHSPMTTNVVVSTMQVAPAW